MPKQDSFLVSNDPEKEAAQLDGPRPFAWECRSKRSFLLNWVGSALEARFDGDLATSGPEQRR